MQAFQQPTPAMEFSPMEPGDEKLFVQFYMGALRNEEKTEAEGHPVFDAIPFVKIMVPGDKNTVIDTIADATHKRRFARMWHNFNQSLSQEMSGMPLRDWPAITRAQAEELIHLNVFTVEQLATVADVYGAKIMGIQDLRRKAQAYLEQAKDTAFATKLADENAKLKGLIDGQATEIKRLSDMFEQMQRGAMKGQNDNGPGTRANRSG